MITLTVIILAISVPSIVLAAVYWQIWYQATPRRPLRVNPTDLDRRLYRGEDNKRKESNEPEKNCE